MSDEAAFVIEADKLARSVETAIQRVPGEGGPYEGTVRPFHMILLAVLPGQTAALFVSAFCGVLTVLFAALIARRITIDPGSYAPEFAAVLLATSPSHVFFSRLILAEAAAICLLCGAILLYLSEQGPAWRRLAGSGLCLGIAFGIQPRMTFPALFIVVAEFLAHRDLRRLAYFCIPAAAPLMVMEGLYAILRWAHESMGSTFYPQGYITQYIHMEAIARMVPRLNRPAYMFDYLRKVESLPVYILFFVSLLAAALQRKRAALGIGLLALFLCVVTTLGDQVLFPGKRWGRMLQPAVPLACALIGAFLAECARRSRLQQCAAVLLVVFAVALRAEVLMETVNMKSDAERVMKEAYARAPSPTIFSEDDNLLTWHVRDLPTHVGFYPGADTITVIIFDREYASQFGFLHLLPDTPTFLVEDGTRKSRLQYLESFGRPVDLDRYAPIPPRPAEVYVLPRGYKRPDQKG